jgi:hypothetical protein
MTIMTGRRKPWRGYGAYNNLHCIRLHAKQDGPIDPAECKGTVSQLVLQPLKNFHVGTIPAGSFIMAPSAEVITAFAAGTVSLGTEADIDGLVTAAELAVATPGYKNVMAGGVLLGYVREDLEIFARLDAASATGEFDVVIPFYTNAD